MCQACRPLSTPEQDPTNAAEAFAGEMIRTLNNASIALLLSVGHRTSLFDAMENAGWVTSDELASRAGLNERYVREWLGAMATGRIVEIDGSTDTDHFRLPDAHAAILARSGEGMASVFQWISVLGDVETEIVDVFRNGGGVPYESFNRFHEVMAEESDATVVGALDDHIIPLVDGLHDDLVAGINVLDIGCGSGQAMIALAERYPNSTFRGYDLCQPAVDAANQAASDRKLGNVRFEQRDVTEIKSPQTFDLITAFDVIHDQRDPDAVLRAVHDSLKERGTFLMQDIRAHTRVADNLDNPLAPMFYTISTMHCMTVSLAQGGAGLGTAWGEELAVTMLNDAGFQSITINTLDHDIQNNWYVMTKD